MKFSSALACLTLIASSASAFAPLLHHHQQSFVSASLLPFTRLDMFSGAGAGVPSEDDPAQEAAIEAAAKQLGMPVFEYKLSMRARAKLESLLDAARCVAGETGTVSIERDANNPPKYLEVTITEAGKALGADQVGKKLVAALKEAATASKAKRAQAQGDMMKFIADEMKSAGRS
jgi:hypothetical protein